MRALVVKELPGISIYTVLSGYISGELFLTEDLKNGVRLQDVILEGVRWQVVKAAEEGKEIEVWEEAISEWCRKESMTFFADSFYRIAPEPPLPKHVPFTADDWEMFVGKVVRDSEWKRSGFIVAWDETEFQMGGNWYNYKAALKTCTFLDGSPFGKQIVS